MTTDDLLPNQHARAVARWENEGGAVLPFADEDLEGGNALSPIEQEILQCLGAAVISQWSDLPTEVKRRSSKTPFLGEIRANRPSYESRSRASFTTTKTIRTSRPSRPILLAATQLTRQSV
jgi:hypothetical protein